ncbi:hypothetical protein HXZ64_13375 [Acinetobacter indicus]|uniref:DUF6932 family protein n=1 Tax=Acinetobacter TaxID=469 RepID=UPI001FD3E2F6|nr:MULTISPECIES: hypothetical protein [Acinetobacter]MDM1281934.1 hypothetical protein [Acinetobacter indicus]
MIPSFTSLPGAPWAVLPPGEHLATFKEIESKLAFNPHRKKLFDGLLKAAELLAKAGCQYLYLDGSYVTEKENPSDFDGCWDAVNVNFGALHPILKDFSNGREAQKNFFGGELFPNGRESGSGLLFKEFFQREKRTGLPKGIIIVDLKSEFPGEFI